MAVTTVSTIKNILMIKDKKRSQLTSSPFPNFSHYPYLFVANDAYPTTFGFMHYTNYLNMLNTNPHGAGLSEGNNSVFNLPE